MMFRRSKRSNPKAPKTIDVVTIDCVDYNSDYSEYDADYEQSCDSFRVADYEQSCDSFQVTDNHDNDDMDYKNSSQSSRWASFEGSIRKQLVEESPVAAQRKLSCSMRWIDTSKLLDESPMAATRRVSAKDLPPQLYTRRRSRMSGASISSIPPTTTENENENKNEETSPVISLKDLPPQEFTWRRNFGNEETSPIASMKDLPPQSYTRRRSRLSGASIPLIPSTTPEHEETSQIVSLKDLPPQLSIRRKSRISGASSSRMSGASLASIPDEEMLSEEEPEVQNREQQSIRDRRRKRGQVSELVVSAAIACAELRKHRGHQLPRFQTKKSPARKNQRCSDTSEDKSQISCYRRQSPVTS
jgi:hypothetical protein